MVLDRTHITLGTGSTIVNKTWENAFKNKINNLLDYTVVFEMIQNYIYNLQLEYVSATQITLKKGICRNDVNTDMIRLTSDQTLDITTSGANGLDTGVEAVSTWYYVYVIKNNDGITIRGLLSTSPTNPTLPSGYEQKRLVGAIYNNSLGDIHKFYAYGNNNYREFLRDEALIVASLDANGFQNVSVTTFVPVSITKWGLYSAYNRASAVPTGGTSPTWYVSSPDSDSSLTYPGQIASDYRGTSAGKSGDSNVVGWVPCDDSGIIQARRDISDGSPTLNIYNLGFAVEL